MYRRRYREPKHISEILTIIMAEINRKVEKKKPVRHQQLVSKGRPQ